MALKMSAIYNMEKLIDFYNQNVKKHKDGIKSVAWGSKESQQKRFEILSQIANLEGQSVLDVGCGLGDFYGWLRNIYSDIGYTGIDITPSMIEIALKSFPGTKFKVQNILELKKVRPTYDYVFASGIFNRRIRRHKDFVMETVERMFALSNRGIAFNIMSTKADFMEKNEHYADPCKMLNFCMNLSRRFVLRHDYMPHDFTIYVYKEQYE